MRKQIQIRNKISLYNPLAIRRRRYMRNRLKNDNITFLTPNCIGGILFHDLGLEFKSPTVNMMMLQTDFYKFVMNLDKYIEGEIYFFKHPEYNCPCAKLKSGGVDEITIHFTHYESESDALEKWKSRCKRINKDNIFIFIQERDGLTREQISNLGDLRVRGIVCFTYKDYKDIPYSVYLSKYANDGEVGGDILKRSWKDDSRGYEKYFDFVKWFNEANGGNYDVSEYTLGGSNVSI